ncbi:MAG TPA: hypothetical protein IAD07_00540 [Candidatus Fimivicinus intestinavium]|nr:hypothetical protein [Candidatus Fimivicinus intestinavium]
MKSGVRHSPSPSLSYVKGSFKIYEKTAGKQRKTEGKRGFFILVFNRSGFPAVFVKKMLTIAGFRTIVVTILITGHYGREGLHSWKIM